LRDLTQVMAAIIRQIPDGFEYKESLVREFGFVEESIPYTAPEAMFIRWELCYEILSEYIPAPILDWQKTIGKIFSAEVDYKDY